jgi:hypothetical protein
MAGFIMATTTPNYGWDVPTSTDYVKDGATAIETLGDDIDATLWTALGGAYPGLRLVKKQTIGSAVSSVTVTNAFSATYEAYKIICTNVAASSSNATVSMQLSGLTSGYYGNAIFANFTSGAPSSTGMDNASSHTHAGGIREGMYFNVEVINPFLARQTHFANAIQDTNAGFSKCVQTGLTSATGFTITPANGTLTGGTIYVYGYGIS